MLNVIFTKNRAVRIKSGLFLILFLLIAGLAFLSAEPSGLKLLFSDSKTRFISQYGVTWIFDKEVEYGTFITGDYWVVGPVTIISVSPEPSYVSGNYINGSMINPPNGAQAYDSRAEDWKASFDNSLRVNFPATVGVNSSLVSTVSRTPYDATLRPTLQSAAVLTILSEAPPEGSFRPGLIGNSKVIYNVNDIDWSLLPKLKPTTSFPSSSEIASEYTRWLERPWLLHPTGWEHRFSMPAENSPSYHRDVALLLSQASILCLTDWGDRTELVTNFIQVAIDYYTMQQHGLETGIGGAYNYRWPIVFAGIMLRDSKMRDMWRTGNYSMNSYHADHVYYRSESVRNTPSNIIPADDNWTFYHQRTGKRAVLYQGNVEYTNGDQSGHEELHPSEWSWIADAGYAVSEGGGQKSESYRRYHSVSIPGFALCARVFGAEAYVDFPAYFDYADRWMSETKEILDYYGYGEEKTTHSVQTTGSDFVDEMWNTYRSKY